MRREWTALDLADEIDMAGMESCEHLRDQVVDALRRDAAWRPIASVPKDGQEIEVAIIVPHLASWEDGELCAIAQAGQIETAVNDYTHWRPIKSEETPR